MRVRVRGWLSIVRVHGAQGEPATASSTNRAAARCRKGPRNTRVRLWCCRMLLSRPTCRHGIQLRPRAWNVYWPCKKGCGTVEPERLYHRWSYRLTRGRYDPFGRAADGKFF